MSDPYQSFAHSGRTMTQESSQHSLRTRIAIFAIVAGVGLFLMLSYFGVIHWPPIRPGRRRAIFSDPHHWQILSIAIAFISAGASFIVPRHWHFAGRTCGIILVVSLLAGVIGSFLAS
ncbi:MAG: hypothetical protein JNN01_19310 [Opitutaceae bacterium]|nr:hypothetical protein [Opitutaceae bacterium]